MNELEVSSLLKLVVNLLRTLGLEKKYNIIFTSEKIGIQLKIK